MAARDKDDDNPFASPESDLSTRREEYQDDGERGHAIIDAGEVVTASWEIFKSNAGLAIGGFLVAAILMQLCGLPQLILNWTGLFLASSGDKDSAQICQLLSICCLPITMAGNLFFQAGLIRLMLNVAQGKNAQIGDLFSGGKFFWRMLGNSIVVFLMIAVGILACIVPGFILSLMFGSFSYALVDQDPPGFECLNISRAATKGNLLTLFVILLAAFGVILLGMLAFCVGLFVSIPLVTLFFVVAYCKMTGQRTAELM